MQVVKGMFGACLMALLLAGAAFASVEEFDDDDGGFRLFVLFDPGADPAARQRELARAEEAAVSGNARAQYALGTLYRLGMRHPARLVERDDEQAERYLSNAAVRGHTGAMAGMAELKLRRREYLDAMVWAQAYVRYEAYESELRGQERGTQAAAASMIQRAQAGAGRDKDEVLAYVLAFLQNHDGRIRAAIDAEHARVSDLQYTSSRTRPLFLTNTPLRASHRRMSQPGMAYYLVEVGRDGHIARLLVVDSLPDERYARQLEAVARGMRFNADPDAGEVRRAIMPLSFDDGSVSISRGR
ncbi:hypothetical protein [Coralloluteibacterium thermophilus]|uniref:TonB C-terminal domain-containing protein n=1 Tax=Coralloluteibacterium thermophilum TaxID=2707049 RepID=A0ABV9NM23_9GAMM